MENVNWAQVVEIIEALIPLLSGIVAGVSVFLGYRAWRGEFVGKRKIDLAEKVLALFYEVEDAIRGIRSQWSNSSEGKSRECADNETEEESRFLDQAYVVHERYKKKEKLFSELRSMKYRVMATFGSSAEEPFKEIEQVLREIYVSAWLLGNSLWPRQGRENLNGETRKMHLKEIDDHQNVIWWMGDDRDDIGKRVHAAVGKIEAIIEKTTNKGKFTLFKKKK